MNALERLSEIAFIAIILAALYAGYLNDFA